MDEIEAAGAKRVADRNWSRGAMLALLSTEHASGSIGCPGMAEEAAFRRPTQIAVMGNLVLVH